MAGNAKSKPGVKPHVSDNVNTTLEALGLDGILDDKIRDIVQNPDENPKLFEKILEFRLKHGKQLDPREEFSNLAYDTLAKRVCHQGLGIHPDFHTLKGIKEHLTMMNIPCPLHSEGELARAKKNSHTGN